MPAELKAYQADGVQFIELSQARTTQVLNAIDDESEIGLNKPDYRQHIVDLARGAASGTLEADFEDLDKKWSDAAQERRLLVPGLDRRAARPRRPPPPAPLEEAKRKT